VKPQVLLKHVKTMKFHIFWFLTPRKAVKTYILTTNPIHVSNNSLERDVDFPLQVWSQVRLPKHSRVDQLRCGQVHRGYHCRGKKDLPSNSIEILSEI
jgi:hypothetical protein